MDRRAIKRALPPAGIALLVAVAGGVTGGGVRLDERASPAGGAVKPMPVVHALHVPIARGALRLEGQVVDADDRPVAGATVMLAGARATTTEADGAFAYDDLAAARYTLAAAKGARYGEDSVRLDATSDPVVIHIRLAPTLVLHVRDAAGPIVGAAVDTSARSTTSDAAGDAVLRGIDVGYEIVTVTARGHAPGKVTIESDDPGATIERSVTLASGATIEGIVLGPDGPVAEATVDLEVAGGQVHASAVSDAAGHWRIDDVAAGKHVVSATASRYFATPDEIVDSDGVHTRTGVVVRVDAGGEISGIVVDARGAPVADARVSAAHVFETTDANGRFTATGLEPGTYELSATSATGASRDVTLDLARRGQAEVRLVLGGASIAGVVVDVRGEPIDGARVVADAKDGTRIFSVYADDRGRFDLGGVLPGEYMLAAERTRSRHDLPPPVAVTAGDRRVRLVVPDLVTLTGRVIADGAPVDYFGVVATQTEDVSGRATGVRAANGRFTERELPPGAWGVAIVAPGFAPRIVPPRPVAAGATLDLGDIVLDRGRVLRGRVVDARGAAVAGATVTVFDSKDTYTPGTLRALQEGTLSARTDRDGRYAISGLSVTDKRIEATHPDRGASIDRALAAGDGYAELVIVGTGGIAGWIADMTPRQSHAIATAAGDEHAQYTADIDGAGTFYFAQLPPGDYIVHIVGRNEIPDTQVTIIAGAQTPVTVQMIRHGE